MGQVLGCGQVPRNGLPSLVQGYRREVFADGRVHKFDGFAIARKPDEPAVDEPFEDVLGRGAQRHPEGGLADEPVRPLAVQGFGFLALHRQPQVGQGLAAYLHSHFAARTPEDGPPLGFGAPKQVLGEFLEQHPPVVRQRFVLGGGDAGEHIQGQGVAAQFPQQGVALDTFGQEAPSGLAQVGRRVAVNVLVAQGIEDEDREPCEQVLFVETAGQDYPMLPVAINEFFEDGAGFGGHLVDAVEHNHETDPAAFQKLLGFALTQQESFDLVAAVDLLYAVASELVEDELFYVPNTPQLVKPHEQGEQNNPVGCFLLPVVQSFTGQCPGHILEDGGLARTRLAHDGSVFVFLQQGYHIPALFAILLAAGKDPQEGFAQIGGFHPRQRGSPQRNVQLTPDREVGVLHQGVQVALKGWKLDSLHRLGGSALEAEEHPFPGPEIRGFPGHPVDEVAGGPEHYGLADEGGGIPEEVEPEEESLLFFFGELFHTVDEEHDVVVAPQELQILEAGAVGEVAEHPHQVKVVGGNLDPIEVNVHLAEASLQVAEEALAQFEVVAFCGGNPAPLAQTQHREQQLDLFGETLRQFVFFQACRIGGRLIQQKGLNRPALRHGNLRLEAKFWGCLPRTQPGGACRSKPESRNRSPALFALTEVQSELRASSTRRILSAAALICSGSPGREIHGGRMPSPNQRGMRCRWKWNTLWKAALSLALRMLRPSAPIASRITGASFTATLIR